MDPKLHETNVEQMFGRVIAVDYDGCLAKNGAWPEAGELDMRIVAELLKAREEGATLILWTCRTEYALEQAVKSCRDVGLEFDAVNDYPPLQASMFETLARRYGPLSTGTISPYVFVLAKIMRHSIVMPRLIVFVLKTSC